MQTPTEIRLLLETARGTRATLNRDRIRALAGGPVDWARVLSAAERHQVTPLVHRVLQLQAADLVPVDVLRQLAIRSLTTAGRNRRFAEELVRLDALFLQRSLEVISYKGPTAAVQLYGDLRLRTFGDMDFLVKRGDLDAVCGVLREQGYQNRWTGTPGQRERMEREEKEYCFVSGPITVEPHWSITARRFPFDIDYPSLWSRAQEIPFDGSKLLTFGPEDMLLVLCVCGGKGRWQRIQMVSDVAETVRTWPDLNWSACFERAASSGSARMLRVGLHLARTLLDVALPDHVIQRIDADRQVPGIAARVVKVLWPPRIDNVWTRQGPAVFSPILFSLREGIRDKLRYLIRTTTTPNTVHEQRFPLSRSMAWAYYLIVPLHDYIVSPAWYLLRKRLRKQSRDPRRSP
ncbi:MAG: nucleotidyltransferase family protein [Gammaproteobacteria bacterium]